MDVHGIFNMKIYIFNPETDFALGHNRRFYTPSKSVVRFRDQFALLPILIADPGDRILITSSQRFNLSDLPFFPLLEAKDVLPLFPNELSSLLTDLSGEKTSSLISFSPWGWNPALLHYLENTGTPPSLLPDSTFVDHIRELSNRRLTTVFYSEYGDRFPDIYSPSYLATREDLEIFAKEEENFVLKAPWSSSGRGIVISTEMENEKIMEWGTGTIRSQGGVMGEHLYDVKLNFASEWNIEGREITYLGLSLFKTSGRGKYKGNLLFSQSEISKILTENSDWSDEILEVQKEFIERNIAPNYTGPLGFDMLSTTSGAINPCVEVNIRHTMGHIAIRVEREMNNKSQSKVGKFLHEYFPDNIFNLENLIK